MNSTLHWHKIAEHPNELAWQANGMVQCEVAGKKICISKTKEGLSGCSAGCPHAGGRMADGFIDAMGNIVCPLHRYRFSLKNGRNVSGEGYYLRPYPVEVREEGVFVGIEEKK
ncbi:MAG: hypothetical protein RLY16_1127 [Bacteroidota bacterium]